MIPQIREASGQIGRVGCGIVAKCCTKKECLRSRGFVRRTDEPAAGSLNCVISHTLNDRRNQLKIEYVHPPRYCIGAGRKIALSISITNRYPDSPTSRGKVVSCGIPEPCPLVGMPCRQGVSPKWWIPTLIRQTSLYTVFLMKANPPLVEEKPLYGLLGASRG